MSIANYKFGIFAEKITIILLGLKGYKIISRRYKNQLGEVDIIAYKQKSLHFIEVKATKHDNNFELLTSNQKNRIKNSAKVFLANKAKYQNTDINFDLVIFHGIFKIKHIKNAF